MGASSLLLVPTGLEWRRLLDLGGLEPGFALQQIAGFGVVAAAARTASLIERLAPRRVLLVGIAGSYDPARWPIGSALVFDAVSVHGIGAGEGEGFLGPPALGFPQWPSADGARAIEDRLELARPGDVEGVERAPLLVTTTAASANEAQAAERRRRYPTAAAEDMEGFAVAFACALAGVPCAILRGISNRVGDRAPEAWNIPLALAAVQRAVVPLLSRPWTSP